MKSHQLNTAQQEKRSWQNTFTWTAFICLAVVASAPATTHASPQANETHSAPDTPQSTLAEDSTSFTPMSLNELENRLAHDERLTALFESHVRRAEAEHIYADARPDPTLSYDVQAAMGGLDFVDGSQHAISLTFPVRLRRKGLYRRDVANAEVGAVSAEVSRLRTIIFAELRQTYYRAQTSYARREVFRSLVRNLDELIEVVETREAAGIGNPYDTRRLQLERSRMHENLNREERTLVLLATELAQTVGLTDTLPLPSNTWSESLDEIEERPVDHTAPIPQLAALEAEATLERASLESARRERTPDLDLMLGTITSTIRPGVAFYGGFSITLPFRDGGRADVARAEAEAERARREVDLQRRRLTTQREALIDALTRALSNLNSYQRRVTESLPEIHTMASSLYTNGDIGIAELIDLVSSEASIRLEELELVEIVLMLDAQLRELAELQAD